MVTWEIVGRRVFFAWHPICIDFYHSRTPYGYTFYYSRILGLDPGPRPDLRALL